MTEQHVSMEVLNALFILVLYIVVGVGSMCHTNKIEKVLKLLEAQDREIEAIKNNYRKLQ